MIKAYLYPQFYGGYLNNSQFVGENACRVECTLPAVPKEEEGILMDPIKQNVAEPLYQNCLKQLNNPESVIAKLLKDLRSFLKGYDTEISESYAYDFDEKALSYVKLSDEDLLHKLLFEKDVMSGFCDGMWEVLSCDVMVNDDHLHILLEQTF